MTAGAWTIPLRLQRLIETGWWPRDEVMARNQHRHPLVTEAQVRSFASDESTIFFIPPPFHTFQSWPPQTNDIGGVRSHVLPGSRSSMLSSSETLGRVQMHPFCWTIAGTPFVPVFSGYVSATHLQRTTGW